MFWKEEKEEKESESLETIKMKHLTIPFFILAGMIMDTGGLSRRIVDFSTALVGWITGSLLQVAIVAATGLAAMSGSGSADTAAIATILTPELKKRGYDVDFALGIIATAGSHAQIVPPSMMLVLIGVANDLSIGALFLAGVLPGLLTVPALSIIADIHAKRGGPQYRDPEPFSVIRLGRTFVAAIPALGMAVIIIGGILGRPMELTDGVTGSLPIPARAEIVIEGIVREGDVALEGPLGEFTGYYGRPESDQPVIEVTALHMRRSPILTAALMADYPACEIGAYYAIMRSAAIWEDLERFGIPGIEGVYTHPAAASGWGMTVVSIRQRYAGHVAQVLASAAQCPAGAYYSKWIIAVDHDVDPADMNQVMWAMSTRCHPTDDIDILRKTWSTGLDPSRVTPELRPYGSKALIDACIPHIHMKDYPVRTLIRRSAHDRVTSRWDELGLPGKPPTVRALDDIED